MIMLVSVLFGILIIMPLTEKHVWPAIQGFFDSIWIDPTERAARRLAKKSREMHVLPEMSATGEVEMLAAQTGIQSSDILKSINAVSPSEAIAIFTAIKSGKPLALVKILKILKLEEKAPRMPKGEY